MRMVCNVALSVFRVLNNFVELVKWRKTRPPSTVFCLKVLACQYLGRTLSKDGTGTAKIRIRFVTATAVIATLNTIWISIIGFPIKSMLFKYLGLSIRLYRGEYRPSATSPCYLQMTEGYLVQSRHTGRQFKCIYIYMHTCKSVPLHMEHS